MQWSFNEQVKMHTCDAAARFTNSVATVDLSTSLLNGAYCNACIIPIGLKTP